MSVAGGGTFEKARLAGLEPTASASAGLRSIQAELQALGFTGGPMLTEQPDSAGEAQNIVYRALISLPDSYLMVAGTMAQVNSFGRLTALKGAATLALKRGSPTTQCK